MINKRLLLVEPGSEKFRSYILEELVNHKFQLIIVGGKKTEWAKKYAESYYILDEIENKVDEIVSIGRSKNVGGVLTYSDIYVPIVAKVAQTLSLPHLDQKTAYMCRNKLLLRNELNKKKELAVRSYKSLNLNEAIHYANYIGYPVVVKPIHGHSSIGVMKANNEKDVIQSYNKSIEYKFAGNYGVLIEEYLDGPEVSLECFVEDGKPNIVAITDKKLSQEPYFEEIGHTVPSDLPTNILDQFKSVAIQSLTAINFTTGIAHIEARMTRNGPKIIEIGARLGGDLIPKLVQLSTGINLPLIAANLACGLPINSEHLKKTNSATVLFVVPRESGVVTGFSKIVQDANPNILYNRFWGKVGQVVRLPPENFLTRLGYVVTVGDNSKDSLILAEKIIQELKLQIK